MSTNNLSGVFTITNLQFHNRACLLKDDDKEPITCAIPADMSTVNAMEQWELTPTSDHRYSIKNVHFESNITTDIRPTSSATVFASRYKAWWIIKEMDPATYGPDTYSIFSRDSSELCWGVRDGDSETPIQLFPFAPDHRNLWQIARYPPVHKKPCPFDISLTKMELQSVEQGLEQRNISVEIEWTDLPRDHIIEFPDSLAVLYHGEVIADAEVDEYKTSADTPLRMSLHARDTPAFTAFASSILCDDHIQVTLEAHKFRFYPRKSVERPADWHYVYEALLRKDLTFEGLHAFRENVALSDLKILSSGSDDKETYLESSVNVSIFNTSRFSCAADLAVGVYFGNTKIGHGQFKELHLRRQNPDVHELKWRFRPMNPANQEVQMLLEQHFTTKQQLPVVISVENISATICGRLFNLPRFKINSHIEGLGINLVKHVDVHIGAFGLLTQRKVSFEFTFSNPINAPLELCDIELDVIVKGIRIANVKHHFGENSKSFRIDKKGEAKSPKISNAYLVASYLKTVQLVTDSSACLDIEVKSAAIKIDHYDLQGLTFNMKNIPFKLGT